MSRGSLTGAKLCITITMRNCLPENLQKFLQTSCECKNMNEFTKLNPKTRTLTFVFMVVCGYL